MWMMAGEDPRVEDMRGVPILVAIDESTGWMGAWVVPEKGENWYAIKVPAGYIEEIGHIRVIMKSDQEPAIIKLRSAARGSQGWRLHASSLTWGNQSLWTASMCRYKYCRVR